MATKPRLSRELRICRDALTHPSAEMRIAALKYTGEQTATQSAKVAESVAELLNDSEAEVRILACEALSKAEFEAERFLPTAVEQVYQYKYIDRAVEVISRHPESVDCIAAEIAELLALDHIAFTHHGALIKLLKTFAMLGDKARPYSPQLALAFVQLCHTDPVLVVAETIAKIGFEQGAFVAALSAVAHKDETAVARLKGPRWNPRSTNPYGSFGPRRAAEVLIGMGQRQLLADTEYAELAAINENLVHEQGLRLFLTQTA